MTCGANDKHFKGNLIAYMGDMSAANLAGGFKVSVEPTVAVEVA